MLPGSAQLLRGRTLAGVLLLVVWLAALIAILLLLGGIVAFVVMRREEPVTAASEEPDAASKEEAPPDLQKLREPFAAGLAALARDDGADAVKHLSSFDFGPRPVEEYRLYYLANGHQLAGNAAALAGPRATVSS